VDYSGCRIAKTTVAVCRQENTYQHHHKVKFLHFEVAVTAAEFVLFEEVHYILQASLLKEGLSPIQS